MIGPNLKVECDLCAKMLAPSSLKNHKERIHRVSMTKPPAEADTMKTNTPAAEEVTVVRLPPQPLEVADLNLDPLGTREVEELLVIKQGLDAEIKIYKTLIDSGESDPSEENSSEGMRSRCWCWLEF